MVLLRNILYIYFLGDPTQNFKNTTFFAVKEISTQFEERVSLITV